MNTPSLSPNVTVFARSPDLDESAIDVVVTVPTFRRPLQVLETLASLARQRTELRYAVILIENDGDDPAGARSAMPMFGRRDLEGFIIIAHDRGNCCAYNAGWSLAMQRFPNFRHLLVIDDDEMAGPDWIETMCTAARTFDADIVGGPQVPVFARADHQHLAAHPVFAPPYSTSGPVAALYSSGNLLVSRRVLAAMPQPYLDLTFNFMGGGDSDFLSRAVVKGFKLAWCSEGAIREIVPSRRVEADWIRARSLRNGVISTLVEKRKRAADPLGRLKVVLHSIALLGASPLRALVRLLRHGPSGALYPVHVALGRIGAEFGYANEQYRNPEKN